MGDAPHPGNKSQVLHKHDDPKVDEGRVAPEPHTSSHKQSHATGNQDVADPFHSQLPYMTAPQYQGHGHHSQPQHNFTAYGYPHGAQQAFNMSAMSNALPNTAMNVLGPVGTTNKHQFSPSAQRPPNIAVSPSSYQLQQGAMYPYPSTGPYQNPASFGNYAMGQYPGGFPNQPPSPQQLFGNFNPQQPRTDGMQQVMNPYQQLQAQYYYPPAGFGASMGNIPHGSQFAASYAGSNSHQGDQDVPRQASEGSLSAIPRGPPRKPKQSGHALWIGNLPPGATILDLKDHFSRDATKEIESLFLISKSNCAFVNYRTEAACAAAMQRFHDSRFQGVRLVCRLRRTSAASPGVPTGPASSTGVRRSSQASLSYPASEGPEGGDVDGEIDSPELASQSSEIPKSLQTLGSGSQRAAEKYFIIKSLTLQDLEQSVRNGIWATQAHNEEILNTAFESADNVYLVFSANKSGEYFGYARMISPISGDASQVYNSVPPVQQVESANAPRTISTPATETAPKGRIIDDSSRGTIFWEAEQAEEEEIEEDKQPAVVADDEVEVEELGNTGPGGQAYGKPFRVEWMSTNRLPFYRTRGLRNPWNANRDVKIARDGTELEPTVGRKLIQLFQRAGPSPMIDGGLAGQMPNYAGGAVYGQLRYPMQ